MEVNLEKLIKRCKAKEEAAFEILYKSYYRVLFGIALRYSRTRVEAEDILQEAFIKIFNEISVFESRGSFEGWMKRIVQNTAINSYKRNLKFNLHVELSDHMDVTENEHVNSILDPYDCKDITRFLNLLPDGYRIVINLYYIDGYSHKEIAGLLNISVGTSKSQLFKAKASLKAIIELHFKHKTV